MSQKRATVTLEVMVDEYFDTPQAITELMAEVFLNHNPLGRWSQFVVVAVAGAKEQAIPEAIPEAKAAPKAKAIPEADHKGDK